VGDAMTRKNLGDRYCDACDAAGVLVLNEDEESRVCLSCGLIEWQCAGCRFWTDIIEIAEGETWCKACAPSEAKCGS
jgi:hypothetical protein